MATAATATTHFTSAERLHRPTWIPIYVTFDSVADLETIPIKELFTRISDGTYGQHYLIVSFDDTMITVGHLRYYASKYRLFLHYLEDPDVDLIRGMTRECEPEDLIAWLRIPKNGVVCTGETVRYVLAPPEYYKLDPTYTAPLQFLAPDTLYPRSRRLRVDMTKFKPNYITKEDFQERLRNPDFITVARYTNQQGGGLYHNSEYNPKYCGTFYYIEPDSDTLLYLPEEERMTARNKTALMDQMIERLRGMVPWSYPPFTTFNAHKEVSEDYTPLYQLLDQYPDGKLTLAQFWDVLHGPLRPQLSALASVSPYFTFLAEEKRPADDYSVPYYIFADILSLYAAEDDLDQALCVVLSKLRAQGAILTHMVGRFQIVGEVLDARPRAKSYGSLYMIEPEPKSAASSSSSSSSSSKTAKRRATAELECQMCGKAATARETGGKGYEFCGTDCQAQFYKNE